MKRNVLTFLMLVILLILSACSSSNSTADENAIIMSTREDALNQQEMEETEGLYIVEYDDLQMFVPKKWKIDETEAGDMVILGGKDKCGCFISNLGINKDFNDDTTMEEVYNSCIDLMQSSNSLRSNFEKGMFKNYPAIYYSYTDEYQSLSYDGVLFVADTSYYAFNIITRLNDDCNEEKTTALKIRDSITVNSSRELH